MTDERLILILRFVHLVTMAWGVAGTTVANLMLRFEREPWLSLLRLRRGPWLPSPLFPRPHPSGPETPPCRGLAARVRLHGLISLVGWYAIVGLSVFIPR